ncbi:Uncharacterised protein [Acinetobacter baumannii]|nr:Uncharacterised protein [Acinetobacter baumannii]
MIQDVTIRRTKRHEAETAIDDLIKRGYELVSPLTQAGLQSEPINKYSFEQVRRYQPNDFSSPWVAREVK